MNIQPNGILDFEVYPFQANLLSEGKGNHRKGLFVANMGEETPANAELLSKMLQAAGYDMAEDALVCWLTTPSPFSFASLRNEAAFTHALFFGLTPAQVGLKVNIKPYEPLSLGGATYLFAASIAEIQANPALKRPLWEGMKSMFKI